MGDRSDMLGLRELNAKPLRVPKGVLPTVTAAVVATVLAGALFATPASGTLSSTILARAAFVDAVDLKLKVSDGHQEVIHVPDVRDTLIQQVVLAPGGQSGWHSHPGPVVVLVKSGELTVYDGASSPCVTRTYVAGQAFVDRGQGHAHLARNPSAEVKTEMWLTYFDVPPGASQRVDVPNPGNCSY